jgi:sec-independent protein translocase protein TatA
MTTLLFISGQEIFIIMAVALMLFGANKIPDIAKGLGKGMREFRKATDDIKKEFNESTKEVQDDIKDITDTVGKDMKDVSDTLNKKMK